MQRRQFVSLASGVAALSAAPAFIRSAAAQEVPGLSAKTVTIGPTLTPISSAISRTGESSAADSNAR